MPEQSIRKFIKYLNNVDQDGGYWLPNIQRNFVWKETQIECLFDSIMREYTIGTFLIWKTKSEVKYREFIENFSKDLKISTRTKLPNDKSKMLVLDGQQRLQSLMIGLRGSYERKELYFDILSGIAESTEDMKYKFKFIDSNNIKPNWIKFKNIVSDDRKLREIKESISAKFDNLTDKQKDTIEDNIDTIRDVFINKDNIIYILIDSIDSPTKYRDDDIVEIFIRANSGGTQLGKSDLLFSLLTSSWENAIEKMEDLLTDLNKTGYKYGRDFILKTCLSILDEGAAYNVKKFRDNSTRQSIIDNWSQISDAIKDVNDFIYGKTYIRNDKILPSYLALIPVIYFRYNFPNKWKKITDLEEYLIRTLLTGAFSGSPDSIIDQCTDHIKNNKEFIVNDLFGIIKSSGRNLEISRDSLLSTCYGDKEIHLILNYLYGFNYQPSYIDNKPQIDHIFPQSKLKTIKEINPHSGRKDIQRYKANERNQLANLMLLTAKENGAGGKFDDLPSKWFANKDINYLNLHSIPQNKQLWELNKFEEFIVERKKLLENKLQNLIF